MYLTISVLLSSFIAYTLLVDLCRTFKLKKWSQKQSSFFFQTVHFTSPVLCVSCIQCMKFYFCRVLFSLALYTYKLFCSILNLPIIKQYGFAFVEKKKSVFTKPLVTRQKGWYKTWVNIPCMQYFGWPNLTKR